MSVPPGLFRRHLISEWMPTGKTIAKDEGFHSYTKAHSSEGNEEATDWIFANGGKCRLVYLSLLLSDKGSDSQMKERRF
ncbi:hypothetical protein CEXT_551821 [Caerostris extrusa]|uniref:Uncharacterized protein n=1 Tax=Caerostris extrusa TaxID=172846 RepID=A0AAV4M5Q2_CAEEX|nr:hypothetical protein CEXT_551821 [Caerostris extrusa]